MVLLVLHLLVLRVMLLVLHPVVHLVLHLVGHLLVHLLVLLIAQALPQMPCIQSSQLPFHTSSGLKAEGPDCDSAWGVRKSAPAGDSFAHLNVGFQFAMVSRQVHGLTCQRLLLCRRPKSLVRNCRQRWPAEGGPIPGL